IMKIESKHREVSRQLLSEIAAGKYGPSGRLPGEEQLVRKFGVSRTTIGRALRDLQAEGVMARRAGSGTYVRKPGPNAQDRASLACSFPNWPRLRFLRSFVVDWPVSRVRTNTRSSGATQLN